MQQRPNVARKVENILYIMLLFIKKFADTPNMDERLAMYRKGVKISNGYMGTCYTILFLYMFEFFHNKKLKIFLILRWWESLLEQVPIKAGSVQK